MVDALCGGVLFGRHPPAPGRIRIARAGTAKVKGGMLCSFGYSDLRHRQQDNSFQKQALLKIKRIFSTLSASLTRQKLGLQHKPGTSDLQDLASQEEGYDVGSPFKREGEHGGAPSFSEEFLCGESGRGSTWNT